MVKQQQLRSGVDGQAPLPADLIDGELALNFNANSPALYLKDTAGAVRQVAGPGSQSLNDLTDVDTATTPPVTGDSLVYDGVNYVPGISAASPIGGVSLAYNYDSTVTMIDPGAGDWRADNADVNNATQLAVSTTTRNGNDAGVVWDNINPGDYLGIWEEAGARDSIYYLVTAIVNNTTWVLVDVSVIPGTAASFTNRANTEIFPIDDPSNKLPAGGAAGTVLVKDTAADYDVSWSDTLDGGVYAP